MKTMLLLARRWRDARDAGEELVCGQAAYLSTSHRNMERVGMCVQFVRAVWTEGVGAKGSGAKGSDPSH